MNSDMLMERIRRLLGEIRSGEERRKSSDPNFKRPERRSGEDRRSRDGLMSRKRVAETGLESASCSRQIFQMAQGSYEIDIAKTATGDFYGRYGNEQEASNVKNHKN